MTSAAAVLAASMAPNHPALRWTPVWNPDARGQHRRDGEGTACGLAGPLTLAEPDDKRCPDCFGA